MPRSACVVYFIICCIVLASQSWYYGSNASSIRSPIVDDKMMKPCHWLGLVLCVSFIALVLMIGWQEGFQPPPS